jgi:hypothetical protein
MKTLIASVALFALLCMTEATAQGGGGDGGKGRRQAGTGRDCGQEFVVVRPDGQRERHASPKEFFARLPTTQIDQGENPRTAVEATALLKEYGADWVEVLTCNNRSLQIPSGLPVEGREFLVLTGRDGLKAVRETGKADYRNTIQDIRKLTFRIRTPSRRDAEKPPER